jgi:hypothetical protein
MSDDLTDNWPALTVLRDGESYRDGRGWIVRTVVCVCPCGNETLPLRRVDVRNGHVKSCGCLNELATKRSNTTHGMKRTKTYNIWCHIKKRCSRTDSEHPDYKSYAGRGITVCDQWESSFETFFADMGECPAGGSIERIDNNKGYSSDNCKWLPLTEQSINRRQTRFLTICGEKIHRAAACRKFQVPKHRVARIVKRDGASEIEAFLCVLEAMDRVAA